MRSSARTPPWMPYPPASPPPNPAPTRYTPADGGHPFRTGPRATNSARWCPGHRQPLDAVDERRQQPRRLLGRLDVGHLAAQLLEQHADLAASQVRAKAEMRTATAEAGMRIRRAADVKRPRVGKLLLVTVGGAVPQ